MNNCFAYNKEKRICVALKKKECEGCNFYKTREEAEQGREKAIKRIKSLDKNTRDQIIETYYGEKLEV